MAGSMWERVQDLINQQQQTGQALVSMYDGPTTPEIQQEQNRQRQMLGGGPSDGTVSMYNGPTTPDIQQASNQQRQVLDNRPPKPLYGNKNPNDNFGYDPNRTPVDFTLPAPPVANKPPPQFGPTNDTMWAGGSPRFDETDNGGPLYRAYLRDKQSDPSLAWANYNPSSPLADILGLGNRSVGRVGREIGTSAFPNRNRSPFDLNRDEERRRARINAGGGIDLGLQAVASPLQRFGGGNDPARILAKLLGLA